MSIMQKKLERHLVAKLKMIRWRFLSLGFRIECNKNYVSTTFRSIFAFTLGGTL